MTTFISTRVGSEITAASAWMCDIPVEAVRTDAVQSFVKQETIFVQLRTAHGGEGLGYSYTIGTGGAAVLSLLRTTLLDRLVGMDVGRPEQIWSSLFSSVRATTVGAISSLALAAIDTAVWDARGKLTGTPLWMAAGGARTKARLYDTEGGWLHLSTAELVDNAVLAQRRGFSGVKIKIGKARAHEDRERVLAVREAVGDELDLMVDANQAFTAAEAVRRASVLEGLGVLWFEEPLPADDLSGHQQLAQATTIPIAVGESLYSVSQFREYACSRGASVLQPDVARIGGITPWLKVAHLAEAFNMQVAPHFLMELHVSLNCAVPNALYLEHIPQLRAVTSRDMETCDGFGVPSMAPGLGIEWSTAALDDLRVG